MASTDSHTGGRLEDMAPTGTSIPGDAGNMNTIPSKARPDQANPPSDLSHANPAHAADNAFDIPRSTRDQGTTGEVVTGLGDQLTSNIEKKNLDDAGLDPRAKGHDQYAKHAKSKNPYSKMAGESHGVEAAPGEEDLDQDELLNRRGAQ